MDKPTSSKVSLPAPTETGSSENPRDQNAKRFEIVQDNEWKTLQAGHSFYELHSLLENYYSLPTEHDDEANGVEAEEVIDPPKYSAMYQLVPNNDNKSVIKAQLPSASNPLYKRLLSPPQCTMNTIAHCVALGVNKLATNELFNQYPENPNAKALIIAWQGVSAILVAMELQRKGHRISIFVTTEPQKNEKPADCSDSERRDEFSFFTNRGGKVYRKLEEIPETKYDVVICAFEDQSSGRRSKLSLFGKWLKGGRTIFVDPPVLKCSYMKALTDASGEDYSTLKKAVFVLVPFMPKPYIPDKEIICVVRCHVTHEAQVNAGVSTPIFPRLSESAFQRVKPSTGIVREEVLPAEDSSVEDDKLMGLVEDDFLAE